MAFKRPEGAKKALVQIQLRITQRKRRVLVSPLNLYPPWVEQWRSVVEHCGTV